MKEIEHRSDLFHLLLKYRFKNGVSCHVCGSLNVTIFNRGGMNLEKVIGKCNSCRCTISVTSGTGLDNMKIGVGVFFMLLEILIENPKISSVALAKKVGITQKTAYLQKVRILPVIENSGGDVYSVLSVLLNTNKDVIKENSYKRRERLTDEEVKSIRLLDGIGYDSNVLAQIFGKDYSNIRRIVNNKAYKNV